MDISKAKCLECNRPLSIERMVCRDCGLAVEGDVEVAPLGKLDLEDQIFVTAFLRSHGSLKRMESLFGISYPTVKNRLGRIVQQLDASIVPATTTNTEVLDQLADGEITVDEALAAMS